MTKQAGIELSNAFYWGICGLGCHHATDEI